MTRRRVAAPAPAPRQRRGRARRARPTCADFAAQFVRLTPAQRVLLRVAVDEVDPADLPRAERAIAAELFGDVRRVPDAARVVSLWLLGRGSGKSTLAALVALYRALTVDLAKLAPGEQAMIPVFAVDQRQARIVLGFARGFARSRREMRRLIDAETRDGFTLVRGERGVRIEVLPCTPGGGAARGRSIAAVLDEVSFWDDGDAEASATDLVGALSPRLMPGAQITAITSAWSELGWVGETCAAQHGRPETVLVARGKTSTMRAGDSDVARMIARERARDPDNAAREYDCLFLSREAGHVFAPDVVAGVVDPRMRLPALPELSLTAFAGIDLGFSRDASALVIVRLRGEVVEVVDVVERRPAKGRPLRPSVVLGEDFAPRMAAHRCRTVTTDVHHEAVVREHLSGMRVVRLPDGATGKLRTHQVAQDAVGDGRVRMPRHPRLVRQLGEVVARPKPAGGVSISSPRRRGRHGDLASAFVAAVWLALDYGDRRAGMRGSVGRPSFARLQFGNEPIHRPPAMFAGRASLREPDPTPRSGSVSGWELGPDGRVHWVQDARDQGGGF